jgi:hypothetical protein
MTDPLSVWLDQFTVDDPHSMVPRSVLRAAYGAACDQSGRPSLTETAFGRAMKKARLDAKTAQRTLNGRLQWCYVGIGLRGDDVATSHGSQGSQGYPPISHAGKNEFSESEESIGNWKQDRANPVNPVKAVNGEPPHSADGERVRITL